MSELTSKVIIYKQSGEQLNLGMNFEAPLRGATMSSPTISASPDGLHLSNLTVSGNEILFTCASGTHGYSYRVQIQVETSAGEILIGDGILKVRDR